VTDDYETFEPADLAGVPDEFQRLWTPHRMAYITAGAESNEGEQCPFCRVPEMSDEDGLIVFRGTLAYVVMNLYPYNSGMYWSVPTDMLPCMTMRPATKLPKSLPDSSRDACDASRLCQRRL
jgi:hypothetical protein